MIREATTIKDQQGQRIIGTFIPAREADGQANPIVATVRQGKTYRGIANIQGSRYQVAYESLLDNTRKMVGMLFVGVRLSAMEAVRQPLLATKVGRTGYVWVIKGQGVNRGQYVISKGGKRDNEQLWESKDSQGAYFIREIVAKALTLKPGEVDFKRYPWSNEEGGEARSKFSAFTYFEPWDWIIGAGIFEDEYQELKDGVESALRELVWWLIGAGLVVLVLAVGLAVYMGSRITGPISRITTLAQQIAQGDLAAASAALGRAGQAKMDRADEETHRLLDAVESMTAGLNSLVGQVQRSGIQVTASATQIAASARQLEATAAEQAASTNQVSASARTISATSQELVQTMADVAEVAQETATLADAGRSGLTEMEGAMRRLVSDTESISLKLSVINDKAGNISSIVTTITKVADRTNLLSLNAAIEAEKAGQFGLGFGVVAREIRLLADQTAVAALDIEQMVKEMQSAVSSGVMGMDKFAEEVRRGAERVGVIGTDLARIIADAQALSPRFEEVHEGVESQAHSARQISEAMAQLTEAARHTTEALHDFQRVVNQLTEAARGLQAEVSRFSVSA
jgi:methyl-accepting chemotaxis protein WspA